MTPEQLTEQLKEALPSGLQAVVLYGSAVAGDHVSGASDYNVLVVADHFGLAELKALSKPSSKWADAGNRPPLLFTPEEIKQSSDAFPIEMLDIRQSRRVLFGTDPLTDIGVSMDSLRLQLERELKGKLLQLRERYLLTKGRPRPVKALMVSSLSTFLVLFRAALRLWQDDVPARKQEAVVALARHIQYDPKVFQAVGDLKTGRSKASGADIESLFAEYLSAIERIVNAIDHHVRGKRQGGEA